MISREELIEKWPLRKVLESQGVEIKPNGKEHVCRCLFHDDQTPSMSLDLEKGIWFCFVCKIGGSVIDLVMRLRHLSVKETLRAMATEANLIDADNEKPHKTATYEYRDSFGRSVMFVDRIEEGDKKRFRQYHKDEKGNIVNNIEGVQRILYRMEEWSGRDEVALVEGEKCCHALEAIGYFATTNPGGSGGWMPAYAEYLKDKNVDIWPDNDEPGEKWLKEVLASLEGKVESLRVMRVPDVYGDVADLVTAQGLELAIKSILEITKKTPRIKKGVMIALMSASECYDAYKLRVSTMDQEGIDFGRWLPSFKIHTRILLPGDMAVILADTGVGKTVCLSNIAASQYPNPGIFFQLELSPEAMCERFIAHEHRIETLEVERSIKSGEDYSIDGWKHIYICPKSNITVEEMETIINRSELKIGKRPLFCLIDYLGLVGGGMGKRYERLSTIAESLKVMARTTNTVVILACQVRRDPDRTEISLHDGRDSSSIENSAQLVIGAWRPAIDKIILKILKNTKRAGQPIVECLFDGHKQRITELALEKELYYEKN